MTISGSLEDVTAADVIQFVHFGRGTGTLSLTCEPEEAEIGFHEGGVINAWVSGSPRLGELLVAKSVINEQQLSTAIEEQRHCEPPLTLGDILINHGWVDREQVHRAATQQIKDTILRIIGWRSGTFNFMRGNPRRTDDLTSLEAYHDLAGLKLNTERILLEAAQIIDEAPRNNEPLPPLPRPDPGSDRVSTSVPLEVGRLLDADLEEEEEEEDEGVGSILDRLFKPTLARAAQPPPSRLEVRTEDGELYSELIDMLSHEGFGPHGPQPFNTVAIVDLRTEDCNTVRRLLSRRPMATVVAIVDEVSQAGRAYSAGATATVPSDPAAIVACLRSLAREQRGPEAKGPTALGSALTRLRRVMNDIRSGVMSTTVALTLMNFIGEAVERSIIFLRSGSSLDAIGAFGFGVSGRPLAELSRGLLVASDEENVLTESATSASTRSVTFQEARLPPSLHAMLGHPAYDQVVTIPVIGTHRVLAVIYADNGNRNEPIRDVDILEIASAQVGAALENEILRRELSKREVSP